MWRGLGLSQKRPFGIRNLGVFREFAVYGLQTFLGQNGTLYSFSLE